MTWNDFDKSYKQLDSYLSDYEPVNVSKTSVHLPNTKYTRFYNYVKNKRKQEENPQSQETIQFAGWKFSPENTYKPQSSNKQDFDIAFDEVIKSDANASKWRDFLTEVARRESNFNQTIQNSSGAPAWGYFQFMQSDDGKYNNIQHYAGTDVNTFLNDPQLQIKSAIKLVEDFDKSISNGDKLLAKRKGLDLDTQKGKEAALHAMWLAGPGGFRKWLNGKDVSDSQWYSTGGGTSVEELIKKYNS